MARSPRQPTPSALDGYRRLSRTRTVRVDPASTHVRHATAGGETRSGRRTTRIVGMLRLAGFVGILAVIVGTSVSLASADSTRSSYGSPAADESSRNATIVEDAPRADASADDPAAAVTEVAEPTAVPAAAQAVQTSSSPRPTSGESLPFTGESSVLRLTLAAAALVLLGMLVQIATQPLPARTSVQQRGR